MNSTEMQDRRNQCVTLLGSKRGHVQEFVEIKTGFAQTFKIVALLRFLFTFLAVKEKECFLN
jgi:hypothetical protein